MTKESICDFVTAKNVNIAFQPCVTSTNTLLKQMAADGAPHGSVLVASAQSAGRGRMGRSFFSPDDTGIYMSILLRPDFSAQDFVLVTSAAAVAVCNAVQKVLGIETQIKWVNDVFYKGKKVCGILAEASFAEDGIDYAIVGIGVNVYAPVDGFPKEIENIAGCLAQKREENLRSRLVAQIINEFFEIYESFQSFDFMVRYREKSFVIGKRVTVVRGESEKSAVVTDIDERCRLHVVYDGGECDVICSGEISIRAEKGENWQ